MRRVLFVIIGFVIVFTAVLCRLFYWQVLAAGTLTDEAMTQYENESAIHAKRGAIVDVNGSPFAINVPASRIYAIPPEIENVRTFSTLVGEVIGIDPNYLTGELSTPGLRWYQLVRRAGSEQVKKIQSFGLTGIGVEPDSMRFYPEASMAAHLLGFVGSDSLGRDVGYFGLEGYYDRELRGRDGRVKSERDVLGIPILLSGNNTVKPEDGNTLYLWIDKAVQRIVEDRLRKGIEKYGAKSGTVILMDPNTGGILAMAAFPSYDPQTFASTDPILYKNPIVADLYEKFLAKPGSGRNKELLHVVQCKTETA